MVKTRKEGLTEIYVENVLECTHRFAQRNNRKQTN